MTSPSQETRVDLRHVAGPLPRRYRVIRRLAAGGMGAVWAAQDELLGRAVAVKVLAENLAGQDRFLQRFEREARTAAKLSGHPNVLTIYDVGEYHGRPFIVMQYLGGGTVADRLRAADVPTLREIVSWLRQAATALDFAHEQGVVHRDVKPSNLLFDDSSRLAIADFGIAHVAYEKTLTETGELLGTAAYFSPEQARGDSGSPASDRYSLAVVAYELLTGEVPFKGKDFVEQALAHIETVPLPASEIAPELPSAADRVLAAGLAKEASERWPSASGFVEALADAIEPTASPAEETPAKPRDSVHPKTRVGTGRKLAAMRPPAARRMLPIALFVGAAIATGVVAALSLSGDGNRATPGTSREQPTRTTDADKAQSSTAAGRERQPEGTASLSEASRLNDEGFQLMGAGKYDQAIPLLERAVAAFPENSTELTYAYALYNLGRSLRLAGRAREAIPLLERRLRIENQRDTVARELRAARREAGVEE